MNVNNSIHHDSTDCKHIEIDSTIILGWWKEISWMPSVLQLKSTRFYNLRFNRYDEGPQQNRGTQISLWCRFRSIFKIATVARKNGTAKYRGCLRFYDSIHHDFTTWDLYNRCDEGPQPNRGTQILNRCRLQSVLRMATMATKNGTASARSNRRREATEDENRVWCVVSRMCIERERET